MIITEKQLVILLTVFRDTLSLSWTGFALDQPQRLEVYNTIVNQQSDILRDVSEEKK